MLVLAPAASTASAGVTATMPSRAGQLQLRRRIRSGAIAHRTDHLRTVLHPSDGVRFRKHRIVLLRRRRQALLQLPSRIDLHLRLARRHVRTAVMAIRRQQHPLPGTHGQRMRRLQFRAKADRLHALVVRLVPQVAEIQFRRALVGAGMPLQGDACLAGAVVEHQLAIGARSQLAGLHGLAFQAGQHRRMRMRSRLLPETTPARCRSPVPRRG
jgi:hypothetical protein